MARIYEAKEGITIPLGRRGENEALQVRVDITSWVENYGNGTFGPADSLTREQMAAILWRYAKYKGCDVSVGEDTNILSYTDFNQIDEYAIPAMQWACGAGLLDGTPTEGTGLVLEPKGATSRAMLATLLMRFCEYVVK